MDDGYHLLIIRTGPSVLKEQLINSPHEGLAEHMEIVPVT